jgi:hypothetical protein
VALPAGSDERDDDAVADHDGVDALPHRFDFTRSLMTVDTGENPTP